MAKRKRKPTVKPVTYDGLEILRVPERLGDGGVLGQDAAEGAELASLLAVPYPPEPEQVVTSIGDGSETEPKPAPPPATRVEVTYRLGPHGSGWRVVSTYRGDRLISEQLFAHFAKQEE